MSLRLAHRGPDGTNLWNNGSAAMGHRMLWTTPESIHEYLPFTNFTEELVITADARIDNQDELMRALDIRGKVQENISDSQLILFAYEKWGEHCPEHLVGDFAFAIYDKRTRSFFCARDPFGIKPFYYFYLSHSVFAFASEIKPLFCLPEARRRVNDVQIGLYLASSYEDKEITFYQDVLRLAPGHCMVVSPRKKRMQQYWALDPLNELRLASDQEYAMAFRGLFTEAVHCRMRSAFPVGSALSGGLDSSAITCVAHNLSARHNGGSWHTFSSVFDGRPECDEKPYINEVLSTGAYSPHFVRGDLLSPLVYMEQSPWRQDEPFTIPNLFLFWNILNTAQQQGIRVFLDGQDGDTTVSHGEGYFVELANGGRWIRFLFEAARFVKRFDDDYTSWDLILRYGLKPFPERILKHFNGSGSGESQYQDMVRKRSIKQSFADRISLKERIQLFHWERSTLPKTQRACHYLGLNSGLIPYINEIINKTAEAFNINVALPFFDRRLAEFCLSLPPDQKRCGGWNRMVMRRAMENILPEKVRWRGSKADLSANFSNSLLNFERTLLEKTLQERSEIIEDYVDIPALRKAHASLGFKKSSDEIMKFWNVLNLALWLEQAGLSN
jgi:asparagine synthase (glutamine-hydrolysing)